MRCVCIACAGSPPGSAEEEATRALPTKRPPERLFRVAAERYPSRDRPGAPEPARPERCGSDDELHGASVHELRDAISRSPSSRLPQLWRSVTGDG
jgi:hypothetical protein